MKNKKYISNQVAPWDGNSTITPLECFIMTKYKSDYAYKHKFLSESTDIVLLNSYKLTKCKFCNSDNIKANGHYKSGIKRYYCNNCNKSFNVLTKTILDDHKLPISEWISFCLQLFNYSSIQLLSRTDKKSPTTINLWLHKVFYLLKHYQDKIVLDDYAIIDETYYTVEKSEIIEIDGKRKRGLSKDKYCIAVGCSKGRTFAVIMGRGKPSKSKVLKTYASHIQKGSLLIHDKEKSHNILVKTLNLIDRKYDSKELKKIKNEKDNPLYEVNHIHSLLKSFLKAHSGFEKKELQDYINLFCFIMNEPKDKLEKVEILLDSAISSDAKIKFRDIYALNS